MQCFFTGTVSPQRYEYICKRYGFKNDGSQDNEIITKIQRLFLERIRKEKGYSIKHWCVTEKGHTNTRRVHIHGLYYATHGETKWQLTKLLYENWIDGYKYYGSYVNEKTINYVSKYMTKKDEDNPDYTSIVLCNEELEKLIQETGIQESNAVATIAVRRFLERWRKKYKKSVKHFLITELGIS